MLETVYFLTQIMPFLGTGALYTIIGASAIYMLKQLYDNFIAPLRKWIDRNYLHTQNHVYFTIIDEHNSTKRSPKRNAIIISGLVLSAVMLITTTFMPALSTASFIAAYLSTFLIIFTNDYYYNPAFIARRILEDEFLEVKSPSKIRVAKLIEKQRYKVTQEFSNLKTVAIAATLLAVTGISIKLLSTVSAAAAITFATASLHTALYSLYARLHPLIASQKEIQKLSREINRYLRLIKRTGEDIEGFNHNLRRHEPISQKQARQNTLERIEEEKRRQSRLRRQRQRRRQRARESWSVSPERTRDEESPWHDDGVGIWPSPRRDFLPMAGAGARAFEVTGGAEETKARPPRVVLDTDSDDSTPQEFVITDIGKPKQQPRKEEENKGFFVNFKAKMKRMKENWKEKRRRKKDTSTTGISSNTDTNLVFHGATSHAGRRSPR